MTRMRIVVRGAVQGVGFRPFVFRLARELGLAGWVRNSPDGVIIEAEGRRETLDSLVLRLERDKPAPASIQSLEATHLDPAGYSAFEIRASETAGRKSVLVLPDIATCAECLREIFDPADRRHLYPFTNCTHCGPRYSIIEALPYDRPNTTMRGFTMCSACRREYEDPADRRFHAQPNACPACGPRLEFWDPFGKVLASGGDAMRAAAAAIRAGRIVAVKGLGGFHLMTDACDENAVARLRHRKHREEKPLALLFPSVEALRRHCEVGPLEERLLCSPESPIVLLRRRDEPDRPPVARGVAPGNPSLGAMIPYTPLHHVLLREIGAPVVATSGNLSDEPICIDENEALERLRTITDRFLVHDRPIARHVDDSIVRIVLRRELVLRRARGYAPLPIPIPESDPVLAVGGHLKNSVVLAVGNHAFVSQHIGDLENSEASEAFERVIGSLSRLYEVETPCVVADLHPDYFSTRYALGLGRRVLRIQHHYAHIASCMAENELSGLVLGISWDGTGYGTDGTIWGGEFLVASESGYRRAGHLRRFRLPGAEAAVREPRRTSLGLLYELLGEGLFGRKGLPPLAAFRSGELAVIRQMLERRLCAPETSSAGRLFDAAAALLGLRQTNSFEGQAAMELEFKADADRDPASYPFGWIEPPPGTDDAAVADWGPAFLAMLDESGQGVPVPRIARRFHNTLAEMIVSAALRFGQNRVALSGGCFQNRLLMETAVRRLEEEGFRPYWHQRVPPNDGGIALGQVFAAAHRTGRQ